MIKKILFVAAAVLISTSSLFAYTEGDIVLYPEVGIGVAGGQVTVWSGSDVSYVMNTLYSLSPPLSSKDAELTPGFYWSVGCNGSYFFNDSLALIGGLFIDRNLFEVVWETNHGDLKYKIELYRLTIPVGVRFHYGLLMVGGGLYLGAPLSYKDKEEDGESVDGKANLGLFIDAGVNIETTDTNNLLVFVKFKYDLTPSYEEKDEPLSKIRNISFSLGVSYGFQIN